MKNNGTIKTYIPAVAIFAIIMVAWEIIARTHAIEATLISSPTRVVKAGAEMIRTGFLFSHLGASMGALAVGFLAALVIGVTGGLYVGASKRMHQIVRPYIAMANATPVVAIIPLIILWMGFGSVAKIFIIFFITVIPILIVTVDGVRDTDKRFIRMAKVFHATDATILRHVQFYSALPFIFSGMRIAIGRGIVGIVVAEVFGYDRGLGYLIALYGSTYQTASLMFTIALLIGINMILVGVLALAEQMTIKWKV